MKGWGLGLALATAIAVAVGRQTASKPPGKTVKGPAELGKPAIWSLGADWSSRCGGALPVVPAATRDWGATVRADNGAALVWGWTAPGQQAAAEKYAGRLIADVETYVTATPNRWRGKPSEIGDAEFLAARCPGVTSHGYVAPVIRNVLKVFGAAGCVGVPQVYDTDRSTLTRKDGPRGFLRQCVDSYDRAGFEYVLPLLGLSAGLDIVSEWIDECEKMGVPWHLYSLQRMDQKGEATVCAALGLKGDA